MVAYLRSSFVVSLDLHNEQVVSNLSQNPIDKRTAMKRKTPFSSIFILLLALTLTGGARESLGLPDVVNVRAKPQWTETPVLLSAGDQISITATGSWRHDTCCGSFYGPEGDPTRPTNSIGFITSTNTGKLIGAIAAPGLSENYFRGLPQIRTTPFFLLSDRI